MKEMPGLLGELRYCSGTGLPPTPVDDGVPGQVVKGREKEEDGKKGAGRGSSTLSGRLLCVVSSGEGFTAVGDVSPSVVSSLLIMSTAPTSYPLLPFCML